ncbi:hypothetical protein FC40_GL001131 [Ligilactobacillus hayakitensis DSM 18933 = JCM 14209]|uniref:Gram-positive cocci surface proteins LPxTG domain-containing protein n=1 Tax=Ligilactobacillus hayakitensis DSM 18933 = JCM 14209 TaxID=1423755 RepID=A0A0R1WJH5_9LACO|nr:glycoside hydrolase family 68 protein [Ligilactobacillus hayakitensis]KRM17741.1 hypothetical protein FC40_GL001131 [Ligilactobacillus hayakitensis DSM 18933 = JCM 14209]
MKEMKVRKKMYKSKKGWAVATLATTTLFATNVVASADTTDTASTASSTQATPASASAMTTPVDNKEVVLNTPAQSSTTTPSKTEESPLLQQAQSTDDDATTQKETASTDEQGLNEVAQQIAKEAGLDVNNLTAKQIEALNKVKLTDNRPAGRKMTYKDFDGIVAKSLAQDSRYAIPYFNGNKIKNMPAATTRDAQTGEVADLDIWDSWPVQDPKTGYVQNWNGYQLVVAMMGEPYKNDLHLYLLYNKYGDGKFENWRNAGAIFGYNSNSLLQQWSGSATLNSDGSVQLFYTQVDTTDQNSNHQKLATATINLAVEGDEVKIKSVENDRVIFEGDGKKYQSYEQWTQSDRGFDNIAMRDAHIIEDDNGNRYLIFEASTGLDNYEGEDQIYNWVNYGGDAKYNVDNFFRLSQSVDAIGENMNKRARYANAALGIVRISNDEKRPEVVEVLDPLVTTNMVSDEIERPNAFKLGDKYYVFTASRLNHGTNVEQWTKVDQQIGDNVVMLGYYSDKLTGDYKPLNGDGTVLTASVPANWRTATYSYYAVPFEGSTDKVLVTQYMSNRSEVAGKGMNATLAPSFLLQINPDGTTQVLGEMTDQGAWIWNEESRNQDMLVTSLRAAASDAAHDLDKVKPATDPLNPNYYGYTNLDHVNMPGKAAWTNGETTVEFTNTPTTPATPSTKHEVPNTPGNPVHQPTNENKLPQTGNKNEAGVLAGVTFVLSAMGLWAAPKRRKY